MLTRSIRPSLLLALAYLGVSIPSVLAAPISPDAAIYDPATRLVTMPSVRVLDQQYGKTTLHFDDNGLFSLATLGPVLSEKRPAVANFEAASNVVNLTSIWVGDHRYSNARLQFLASGQFQLVGISDPIKVKPTGYENAKNIDRPAAILPTIDYVQIFNARGFADFEQNGKLSYFATELRYTETDRTARGFAHFFRFNPDGSAIDISDQLVEGDRSLCLHPRKAVIADYNGDGIPDIFLACHGLDFAVRAENENGEMPKLILSQPNGKFRVSTITLKYPAFMHSAGAADVNQDGYPDILVADHWANSRNETPVYLLINNRDGTFTEDHSGFQQYIGHGIWSVELLERDGKTQAWISGNDSATIENANSFYDLIGKATFDGKPTLVLPDVAGWPTKLDLVVNGGFAYVLRTNTDYLGYAIQTVNLATGASSATTLVKDFGAAAATDPACAGVGGTWIDWLRPFNGKLIADDQCRSPNLPLGG